LDESWIIKTDVIASADANIAYTAKCPMCKEEIGRMYWGKLLVAQNFAGNIAADNLFGIVGLKKEPPKNETAPVRHEEPYVEVFDSENDPAFSGGNPDKYERMSSFPPIAYFCPFCGEHLMTAQAKQDEDDQAVLSAPFREPSYPKPSQYFCPICFERLPSNKDEIPYRTVEEDAQ